MRIVRIHITLGHRRHRRRILGNIQARTRTPSVTADHRRIIGARNRHRHCLRRTITRCKRITVRLCITRIQILHSRLVQRISPGATA